MVGRPKTVSDDAKPTTISLTPTERLAIHVISENRKARKEVGTTTNEIIVDAIWHLLDTIEHKTRAQIEALLPPVKTNEEKPTNLAQMPSTRTKSKR